LFVKLPTKIGENRKIQFGDPLERCIRCGHCIACCPTDAILYESDGVAVKFKQIDDIENFLSFSNLLLFLRSRRSIRRFLPKEVEKEKINQILSTIRYAPSANNAQSGKFLILTERNKIEEIKKGVVKMMHLLQIVIKFKKILKFFLPNPLRKIIQDPSTKVGLEEFLKSIESGKDPLFYNAPLILISYATKMGGMAEADAGIALTHAMLAAHSLGLGTCWIGYAQEALNRFKKLRTFLGIPKRMRVNGVLIIGHPEVRYYSVPPRDNVEATWY